MSLVWHGQGVVFVEDYELYSTEFLQLQVVDLGHTLHGQMWDEKGPLPEEGPREDPHPSRVKVLPHLHALLELVVRHLFTNDDSLVMT